MSKKLRTKYHVRKRIFLNEDVTMRAFAIAIVEDTRQIPTSEDNWKWGKIQLDFGDCIRHVSFDFDMETKAERRASLFKIRRLAMIINAVKEALELEATSMEAREKPKPKPKLKVKSATN